MSAQEPRGATGLLERPDAGPSAAGSGAEPVLSPEQRRNALLGIVLSVVGIVALLFVVYQVLVSDLLFDRAQHVLLDRFKRQLAEEAGVGSATVNGGDQPQSGLLTGGSGARENVRPAPLPPRRGDPIGLLTIPRLGLEVVVVEGSAAEQTMKGPGHVRSTPMPGERGNVAIVGRRATYGGPFADLDRLRRGDRIRVVTNRGVFVYRVTDSSVVGTGPEDPDPLAPALQNRLTLISTAPAYLAVDRFAVVAELQGRPVAAPPITDRGGVIDGHEDGLTWNWGALPGLLVWGQLLVLALLAASWLYRRWLRWPTYVITTPVLVALLFLVFDAASGVFPSGL